MKTNYRNADAWVIQARVETMFCGNYVNIGELYGSFDGVHFITEARATASGVYPSMVILNDGSKWVRICPAKISAFLLEAIHQHRIQVWKSNPSLRSGLNPQSVERRLFTMAHLMKIVIPVFVGSKVKVLVMGMVELLPLRLTNTLSQAMKSMVGRSM